MVRKIGSNTPSIDPPQLYDLSSQLYAKMGQDVQQASSASMQAFSGLNAAYGANAQRQMAYLGEQEELRAAQARASQMDAQRKQQSTGVLGGLGSLIEGVVGGFAVQEELRAKQEAAALERADKDRKFELDLAKFEYSVGKDKADREIEMYKFQTKEERDLADRQYTEQTEVVDAAVANLSAHLEKSFSEMSAQEGMAYTVNAFLEYQEEYKELFEANPRLRTRFNKAISDVQQNLYRTYGHTYRGEMNLNRRLAVETMNQKVAIAFADRYNEIAYNAGLWSAEEASASLNDILQQSFVMAQKDPAFMTAIQQNPGLMGEFYKSLYAHAGEMYQQFSGKNADIQSTVDKVNNINNIIGQLGYIDDASTVALLQGEMAKLGLPYQDPRSWATTIASTMKNQAESIKLEKELTLAFAANDPMFGIDTDEGRIVSNAVDAEKLFQAINQKEGWNTSNIRAYYDEELKEARANNDKNAAKKWNASIQNLDEYKASSSQFDALNKQLLETQLQYAAAVRPSDPQAIVTDPVSGMPIRASVGGEIPIERRTPEEIEAIKERLGDIHGQRGMMLKEWYKKGIDLENTQNDEYLIMIMEGASPYIQQLQQRNMQNGRVANPMSSINRIPANPPPDSKQSRVPPVNFSGGRVLNQQVVQGQTGTLPFASSSVPLANAVPFQGGVATAPNVGFVPFKGGNVKIVSKPDSKGLTLDSTDPRVAAMMGGKVVYAGSTQTMGNVVVLQTKDGLAEVFTNLDSINDIVRSDAHITPGTPIGSAQGNMEFQVWKTNDPLRSLRLEIPRNEVNPVAYLQGLSGYRKAPDGLGTIDLLSNKPIPVGGANNNVFAGSGYTIYGNLLVTKDGRQRQLTPTEMTSIYPEGMQRAKSYVEQKQERNNLSTNQPVRDINDINNIGSGRQLKNGFRVINQKDFAGIQGFSFPLDGEITGDQGDQHRGVDIFAPVGAPIRNAFAGTVVYAIADSVMTRKYGTSVPGSNVQQHSVKIKLDNPIQFEGKTIRYAFYTHLSGLSGIKKGQRLEAGHVMGKNGHANAPHLHWGLSETEDVGGNKPLSNRDTLRLLAQLKGGGVSSPSVQNVAPRMDSSGGGGAISNARGYSAQATPTNARVPGKTVFAEINHPLLKNNIEGARNLAAFAEALAYGEGTKGDSGYTTRVGGARFDNSKPHPKTRIKGLSDAHGKYQALASTWTEAFGGQNPPMTPANQDIFYVTKLIHRGALEDVLAGNFEKAARKVANEWVSITGATGASAGQGRYTPAQVAAFAQKELKNHPLRFGTLPQPPGSDRTLVTNAPLHQVNAPHSQSSYGAPNPGANFGYPALAQNTYLRKTIYNVAVKTGKPQQMIADVVARQTGNFSDVSGLNEAKIMGFFGNRQAPAPNRPTSTPQRRTPVTPVTPQDLIPNRRTPVGRSYTSGNQRKKKEWHFQKRSNCPTCQSLRVFIPHFIYK